MAPSARISLLSSKATASATSRRAPASTRFHTASRPARAARAEISLGFTSWTPDASAVAVDDLGCYLLEELALDDIGAATEDRAGLPNVPQSDAAGTPQGAGGSGG